MILEFTKEHDLDKLVNENKLVIVDFWATWCGPCRNFAEVIKLAADKYSDILFVKVDIEQHEKLKMDFSIRSVPHVLVFRENIALYSEPGSLTFSELEDVIKQALAVNLEELRKKIQENS